MRRTVEAMPDGIGRPGQPSPSQEGRPGPGLTPGQRGSSSSCCRGECRHDHDPNPPSHVPAAHSPWSLSDAASRCSQALWLGRHLRKGHIHRRRHRRRRRRAHRRRRAASAATRRARHGSVAASLAALPRSSSPPPSPPPPPYRHGRQSSFPPDLPISATHQCTQTCPRSTRDRTPG